ncbi:unnamed protein product [Cladocopium goreaui]|uniref:Uncharacterized protein n=1 Tax=Cladocopium goreaui TaxID=2562237 RepID=A0A9P1DAA3_9DINO|nr:unnamed protein product [Cladocopium goreaui]|mmetsp:Transcript_45511/g.99120  ORF Transcript_45511/g.99120 Transcript_45511/m.99120 type:complete len:221 (-) Transcript_45511:58-720(-)
MLSDLAVGLPHGPPPQAILEKRHWWTGLLVLLIVTALFEFSTLDVVGGMLTALMLFLACMMLADGMAELPRYALAFSMLSMLCLFFEMVPLLSSIGGRSEVSVEPVDRTTSKNELRITYTTIIKTTPFFDRTKNYIYNGGSVAMILSPVTMLLGAYLAGQAHVELQSNETRDPSPNLTFEASRNANNRTVARIRFQQPSSATETSSNQRFSGPSHRLEPD